MAVEAYQVCLLRFDESNCTKKTPSEVIDMLRAWRKKHDFAVKCSDCKKKLPFLLGETAYGICCGKFYFDPRPVSYPVQSIAVPTPGFTFILPQMKKRLQKTVLPNADQDFLILPDPIYWQMSSTLTFEKVMKFVSGLPVTSRTNKILPCDKANQFYKQIMETPLNYGSLDRRSCGKWTIIRQSAFGKRCVLSFRGMIVPDASLKPNEIRMPEHIVEAFRLRDKWIVLNRMPSLQPGNFVGLRVHSKGWSYDVFGIPLEIIKSINGDFDGDECNVYVLNNVQSQTECETILNSEAQMGCFVSGLKLSPSQDMLAAYHLFYDAIDFLPFKCRDLTTTLQVVYDLYGSKEAFRCINCLRQFYLEAFQNKTCFALTLKEMETLYRYGNESNSFQEFSDKALSDGHCLVTQVRSGAKGSVEHLYQMFGRVGDDVQNSFWKGLNPEEYMTHSISAIRALKMMTNVWEPGYGYSKIVYNLQGLHVDYLGRLVDTGNVVLETDALEAFHHTDLMSEEAFQHLFLQTFN